MKSKIIQNFVPSWPAIVMGTGIVPVALILSSETLPFLKPVAIGFFALSVVLFLLVLILSLLRLTFSFERVKQDLRHPVAGSFFPTLPISFMVLAIDFLLLAQPIIGEHAGLLITQWLFLIGTVGIYALGLIVIPIQFSVKSIKLSHSTYGWFIPPVSHLIIPVVGLELATHFAGTAIADAYFVISIISLGIGLVLYILVGANIYHRYIYHELPASKLAPTFLIGLAPTAILTIIMVKLAPALSAVSFGLSGDWGLPAAKIIGLASWGFSVWWFVLSAIMMIDSIFIKKISFTISWWAFTFPVGALAVSSGALFKLMDSDFLKIALLFLSGVLVLIWLTVLTRTLSLMMRGKAFEEHED